VIVPRLAGDAPEHRFDPTVDVLVTECRAVDPAIHERGRERDGTRVGHLTRRHVPQHDLPTADVHARVDQFEPHEPRDIAANRLRSHLERRMLRRQGNATEARHPDEIGGRETHVWVALPPSGTPVSARPVRR
jgi:hypothetical protein